MSLFQCGHCGCVENTALASQGCAGHAEGFFDWSGLKDRKGKLLCSVCAPMRYKNGGDTGYGKWHGRFARTFLPMGKFRTAQNGNLEHVDTGDQDYRKYEIPEAAADVPVAPVTANEVQEMLRDPCAAVGDYWQRVADKFNARAGIAGVQTTCTRPTDDAVKRAILGTDSGLWNAVSTQAGLEQTTELCIQFAPPLACRRMEGRAVNELNIPKEWRKPWAVKDKEPKVFAVLQAAWRHPESQSMDFSAHNRYIQCHPDEPLANEFRAYHHGVNGMHSMPLGSDREFAEMIVFALNESFKAGLQHAERRTKDPRTEPILVGRLGHKVETSWESSAGADGVGVVAGEPKPGQTPMGPKA